ncbi:hypothetical protein C0J52_10720 [Blattella germanica]|nr:hypothetical protein C0J52_10720 [Blattella germanica]
MYMQISNIILIIDRVDLVALLTCKLAWALRRPAPEPETRACSFLLTGYEHIGHDRKNYCTVPLQGSGDAAKLREAEIIVADNGLLGKELYNLPAAKWVQGTWAGVETLMEHYDANKVKCLFYLLKLLL